MSDLMNDFELEAAQRTAAFMLRAANINDEAVQRETEVGKALREGAGKITRLLSGIDDLREKIAEMEE